MVRATLPRRRTRRHTCGDSQSTENLLNLVGQMRRRRDNAKIVTPELTVAVASPQPADQFSLDSIRRPHECRGNMLQVALSPERAKDPSQDRRVVSNAPAKTGVLCFVPLKAENPMNDAAHIVPIVLLLFVEREHEAAVIGGSFGEIVSNEPSKLRSHWERNQLLRPLWISPPSEDHGDWHIPGVLRDPLSTSGFHEVVAGFQLSRPDPTKDSTGLFKSAATFDRPSNDSKDWVLLRNFKGVGLTGDSDPIHRPVVHPRLYASHLTVSPLVGENPDARCHPLDGNDS